MSIDDELAAEQTYFDAAWDAREHMRRLDLDAVGAVASSKDAVRLGESSLADPNSSVAFGKITYEEAGGDYRGETFYIGRHLISGDSYDPLVVNWQAPVAEPFYVATVDDPSHLLSKRSFRTNSNTILDFDDVIYAELAQAVESLERRESEPEFDDLLLSDLERSRSGEMQDIVQTIQASQYKVMRSPIDCLLVVQGGPGTGKTAVALHRVSWLLFNHRDELGPQDVLVVGPNPTFARYIRSVLPMLGDRDVAQTDVGSLGPVKHASHHSEPSEVSRVKGRVEMLEILRRALRSRITLPDSEIVLRRERAVARISVAYVEKAIQMHFAAGSYENGRQAFRTWFLNEVQSQTRLRDDQIRLMTTPAPEGETDEGTSRSRSFDEVIDRIWPSTTAVAFLRDLYNSLGRLLDAAGDDLTAGEVALLYRRQARRVSDEPWTIADLTLLDALEGLLSGASIRQYKHVVIDEAQDLSPMQLLSISRRSSTGSMTIVGDIAQSTGAWARDSWEEVVEFLPDSQEVRLEELGIGYRVTTEVFDLARQLLPYAAPGVTPPRVVRNGPNPEILEVEAGEIEISAVSAAMQHAQRGRSIGVICPDTLREAVEAELRSQDVSWSDSSAGLGASINLISPNESKGLEFDAVVVIEPQEIVSSDDRGLRLLYIALTRTTTHLTVVHSGVLLPLPDLTTVTTQHAELPASRDGDLPVHDSGQAEPNLMAAQLGMEDRLVETIATEIAEAVERVIAPNYFASVIRAVERHLRIGDELEQELIDIELGKGELSVCDNCNIKFEVGGSGEGPFSCPNCYEVYYPKTS